MNIRDAEGAEEHISISASLLDYNDFNQPSLFQPDQHRSSDHEPVLMGFCDAVPPTLEVTVTPNVLWPPNHQYVRVTTTVTAADNFDPSPSVQLVSVESNEPDSGVGNGNTTDDGEPESGDFSWHSNRSHSQDLTAR